MSSQELYQNQGFYRNYQVRFNNDNYPSSSTAIPRDKNRNREDIDERQEYPGNLSKNFSGSQMPLTGYSRGNTPVYSNMPSAMNMMSQSSQMMSQSSQMMSQSSPMMSQSSPMMMGASGSNPFWNMNSMGMMSGSMPPTGPKQKVILTFSTCVLYPPPPGSKPPSTRQRPPGCRTIFVGSLPENITKAHLDEVFERSGEICSLRVKKNYAHIRFMSPQSVDWALYISGYTMKIDDKDDEPNCGRLHVDYATAREDQYEYECQQRQWEREMRHMQRLEEESLRPPSPPRVIVFNEYDAISLQEKLKNDETTLSSASDIIIAWMERGDCNRKTFNRFYGLLETINANGRRLLSEKDTDEEEIRKLQEIFRKRFSDTLAQFEQIEKVFSTACKKKSWDHFTKPQRKNIDLWFKQIQEINMTQQEEFFKTYQDDSMEMSDGEDGEPGPSTEAPPPKKKKSEIDGNLRFDNDALKCQVEAYKNEIDMAKQESINSLELKDKEIKALQFALQGMQHQLIASCELSKSSEKTSSPADSTEDNKEKKLEKELKEKDQEIKALKMALQGIDKIKKETASTSKADDASQSRADTPSGEVQRSDGLVLTENKLKLIGLISCFLNVHPMGASPDYIWSYLMQMQVQVRASEIEELLEKTPSLFKLQITGCGASLERRWKFTGFAR